MRAESSEMSDEKSRLTSQNYTGFYMYTTGTAVSFTSWLVSVQEPVGVVLASLVSPRTVDRGRGSETSPARQFGYAPGFAAGTPGRVW